MLEYDPSAINAEKGLPEELFLQISSLVPIPNVDLFILDEQGRLLLTRREDRYFGKGWHLPGGCIRFKETMMDRLIKTAQTELGTMIRVDEEPITIKDVIIKEERPGLEDQNMRAHHLAVLFRCYPDDHKYINQMIEQGEAGWFEHIPKDLLQVHDVYRDVFIKYRLLDA